MARYFGRFVFIVLILCLISSFSVQAQSSGDIEGIQNSARKWIDLRLENTELVANWQWQKDILASTLETLKTRSDNLERQKELYTIQNQSGHRALQKLNTEMEFLNGILKDSEDSISVLFQEVVDLRSAFPPILSDALKLSFARLESPETPFPARLQALITILNRCSIFNNTITFSEEVIQKQDGSDTILNVLYWGLSHAYGIDQSSASAYLGLQQDGQWVWMANNEITGQVQQLLAIFHEEEDPAIVHVPVKIQ